MLLDFKLPDGDGLTVLRRIKETAPETAVILMTGFPSIESAVEAIKSGAYHYVNKPFNLGCLQKVSISRTLSDNC